MLHAVDRLRHARILMYSHDTFGLGHLRRCRAIAHALVERFKGLQVLIVSGSSIAGAFEFRTRVDFLKIPSVIKLYNGEYTPLAEHTALDGTLALRRQVIQSTAESFEPDILIVRQGAARAFRRARADAALAEGARHHAGARPARRDGFRRSSCRPNGARADVLAKMDALYDAVWVYGPRDFYDPLADLDAPASLRDRIDWTGFLRREVPSGPTPTLAAMPADACW